MIEFSAPACVIRQYADYMLKDVEIPLTIGKRLAIPHFRQFTDEIRRTFENINEIRPFPHFSVYG